MSVWSRIRSAILTIVAILGVLSVALVVLGIFSGIKPTIVISGSMEPELPVGSLALTRAVPASEVGRGDIVTAPRQDGDGLVTHRVVGVESAPDGITLLTLRGDANDADDPSPYPVREVGEHVMTVPYMGHLALFLRTPFGLVVTLGVLIGSFLILSPPRTAGAGARDGGGAGAGVPDPDSRKARRLLRRRHRSRSLESAEGLNRHRAKHAADH